MTFFIISNILVVQTNSNTELNECKVNNHVTKHIQGCKPIIRYIANKTNKKHFCNPDENGLPIKKQLPIFQNYLNYFIEYTQYNTLKILKQIYILIQYSTNKNIKLFHKFDKIRPQIS